MNYTEPKLVQSHREISLPAVRFYTKRASSSSILARFSRFINKYFYRFGFGSALNRYDNSVTFYSSKMDKKLYETHPKDALFCNFGSGAFFHNRWKNYDYPGQSNYYKSIQGAEGNDFFAIDLCSEFLRIPEEDNSVSLIYCSHTLEHLELGSAKGFLAECYRILKSNGVMRVALPNTTNDFNIVNYIASQVNVNTDLIESFMVDAGCHVLTGLTRKLSNKEISELFEKSEYSPKKFRRMAINAGVSDKFDGENPNEHISLWDFYELISTAKETGFKMCIPLYQGSSFSPPFTNLNVFDTTEPHVTFYAELIK